MQTKRVNWSLWGTLFYLIALGILVIVTPMVVWSTPASQLIVGNTVVTETPAKEASASGDIITPGAVSGTWTLVKSFDGAMTSDFGVSVSGLSDATHFEVYAANRTIQIRNTEGDFRSRQQSKDLGSCF